MSSPTESTLPTSRRFQTFRALRHRNFRLFWLGQIVSLTGTWMQTIAQGWLVYELTDSPFMLGLVNFISLVPVVPVSLVAGVISDRFSRRTIVLIAEIILLLQAAVLALLILTDVIQVWHLMLLSFVLGAAVALEQPARLALVVDMVGREDLSNAIALNSAVFNGARIIGPAAAGLLVAAVGVAGCFILNSATYLVAIITLVFIKLPPHIKPETPLKVGGSMVSGFKYVWGNKTVRALMAIVTVTSFFSLSFVVLATIFASDVLDAGPTGLGFLMAGVGIGAVIGALIVANLQAGHRGKWLTIGNVIGPAILILFALSSSFAISFILIVLVGISNAIRQTLATSLIQITTPEEYQGRVMSIFNLLFNGMSRLGNLGVGAAAEVTGVAAAVGLGAAGSLAWGVFVLWRLRYVRDLP
ncbi:MAG: MFS transporter [Chloroflexi bacterium]|nr:MFS transporter [Chloroflexota bacterium]